MLAITALVQKGQTLDTVVGYMHRATRFSQSERGDFLVDEVVFYKEDVQVTRKSWEIRISAGVCCVGHSGIVTGHLWKWLVILHSWVVRGNVNDRSVVRDFGLISSSFDVESECAALSSD